MKSPQYKHYEVKNPLTVEAVQNSERFDVDLLWKSNETSSVYYIRQSKNAWFKINTKFDKNRVLTTPAVIGELNDYLDESLWSYMNLSQVKIFEFKPANQMRGCQTSAPSKKPTVKVDVRKMF